MLRNPGRFFKVQMQIHAERNEDTVTFHWSLTKNQECCKGQQEQKFVSVELAEVVSDYVNTVFNETAYFLDADYEYVGVCFDSNNTDIIQLLRYLTKKVPPNYLFLLHIKGLRKRDNPIISLPRLDEKIFMAIWDEADMMNQYLMEHLLPSSFYRQQYRHIDDRLLPYEHELRHIVKEMMLSRCVFAPWSLWGIYPSSDLRDLLPAIPLDEELEIVSAVFCVSRLLGEGVNPKQLRMRVAYLALRAIPKEERDNVEIVCTKNEQGGLNHVSLVLRNRELVDLDSVKDVETTFNAVKRLESTCGKIFDFDLPLELWVPLYNVPIEKIVSWG